MKTLRNRRLYLLIGALILCLIIGSVAFIVSHQRAQSLEKLQNEALQELYDNRGRYDEQSIVLTNTSKEKAEALAKDLGATLRITADGSFATLTLPEGVTVFDVYENPDNRPHIKYLSLDYHASIHDVGLLEESDDLRVPMRPQASPADDAYSLQTYLDFLNMRDIWGTTHGKAITVAVIDTGIDTDHPEFVGRISEYSYNASEDKIVKDWRLEDGACDWSLIEDEQGHGTAVTGVIAASMDGKGIVGIAPEVNIIVIKAECDKNGNFKRTSDLVFGLYYAIERDVAVVNMSFGSPMGSLFAEATQLAVDSDIICLAAAGNEGSAALTYPAADENVFGVGALADNSWELAAYSNYGENVDFVAPGTVYTTLMGGGYGYMNGTSFACPVSAGIMALYLSQNRYSDFETAKELVYASCYDLGELGPDQYYGYGAIDVSALISEKRGTVTFNMMTDELDNTEQVFVYAHTLQNMPEPERLYAVFDGWYYDPQCTEEYVWYEDAFFSDLTLYANWVNEDDGIPYTYVELDDGTIEIRSYTGHRRYITIPDYIDGKMVSSIGEFAFAGNTRLREVSLPKYLRRIRASAFSGCSNLVYISIPDTVTRIEECAFFENLRLTQPVIGSESELSFLGDFAFSGCISMREFTVPAKVSVINGSVFKGNIALRSFEVDHRNQHFVAVDGVLFTKDQQILVCYPTALSGSYTLPQATREIGNFAFSFTRLSEVSLTNVESIGQFAFYCGQLSSVLLPDTVTRLGASAFEGCSLMTSAVLSNNLTSISPKAFLRTGLMSVDIPPSVRTIDSYAFAQTSSLVEVNFASDGLLSVIGAASFSETSLISLSIPPSVVSIEDSAFALLTGLTSITFEDGSLLREIGSDAFQATLSLTSVVFPEGLVSLGERAFFNSGLREISLPASFSALGDGAFASCHSLSHIFVDSENSVYTDADGVLYLKDGSALVAYPAGHSRTEYTVLDGVTEIGPYAFHGSLNLQYVYFPEGLRHVREYAFMDTGSLERVILPDSVTVLDDYSFAGCGAKSYILSQNLQEIKAYALSQNKRLAFIAIPDSVLQISNYAFAEDWNLQSVTFTENAQLPRISYGAFAYCGLTSFRVPAVVSAISQSAFKGCPYLQTVTFAQNSQLESLSAYLFSGCINLKAITFESGSALTSIQAHALEGMTSLTTIDLGDAKLTNIDNFAFRFCESLTRFDVPEGVTFLGRYAFYYCNKLSEVTIPTTMDFIGRFAFLGTKDLNVYFAAETLPANLAEDWDHGTQGYYLGVTDVITEGDWTYAKLTSGGVSIIKYSGTATELDLTTLNLGGNIVNIGGGAFMDSPVERIVLPDTLQIIQAEAFYHSELKAVSIPASVTFIGRSAFADTPIESLTFAADAKIKTIEQSAFEKTEKLGSVVIPASVTTLGRAVFKNSGITSLSFAEGFSLTEIPEDAFAYTHVSSVTIPDSVTLINHNAFREIKELKSVTLGNGEHMMIMSNVFYHSGLESVYIPANVDYVGEYAFVALTNLTEFAVAENNPYYTAVDGLLVSKNGQKLIAAPAGRTGSLTVPRGIESIGFGAFEDSRLSEVKFLEDANILSFGFRAFYNADGLTEMHIPSAVITVDYYAFAMCDSLQAVTFAENNSLKGIYEGAFYGCKNLSDILLPDSIAEISDFAFYGCRNLTDVPVSETGEIKGIYDYAFAYTGFSGDYSVPETLIDIGAYAFMGNKFTSVTIPNTNARNLIIGIGAFEDCNEITEITIPFIGASFEDAAFSWFGFIFGAGSYEANAIYIPKSLTNATVTGEISFIAPYAFYNAKDLKEVSLPETISTIGYMAFQETSFRYELSGIIEFLDKDGKPVATMHKHYTGLGVSGEFQLSDNVKVLAWDAFADCPYLKGIVLPEGIDGIAPRAFLNCTSLEYVVIPESVTSIGSQAFSNCSNLKSIHIPNQVTTIEASAFQHCEKLESVYLPDSATNVSPGIFDYCYNLTDVRLPASVGDVAFQYCTALESIHLPEGVTSVNFTGCESLKEVTLPESVTSIRFDGCVNLKTVTLPEGVTSVSFDRCSKLESISLPDAVTVIPLYAFRNCVSLREIILPERLTTIEYGAFSDCSALSALVIPDSVTSIGEHAFDGCSGLGSVVLGSSLQTIGDSAFLDCSVLYQIENRSQISLTPGAYLANGGIARYVKLIIDKEGNKTYTYGHDDFTYIDTADGFRFIYESGKYKLISYLGEENTVTLPLNINGQPYEISYMRGISRVIIPDGMTSISDHAFDQCVTLESIEIPDSVTSIGAYAFNGCTNLQKIRLPQKLTTIQSYTFAGCTSLSLVEWSENLSCIDYHAFEGCLGFESLTLPSSLKIIRDSAFAECASLTSVTLPESITTLGSNLFSHCTSLSDVNLPDNMTMIPKGFLNSCTSLRTIDLPEGLVSFGESAFLLSGLVSIEIPQGVTRLSKELFYACYELEEVIIPDSVIALDADAFGFCQSLEHLVLPEGVTTADDRAFFQCTALKELVLPATLKHIGQSAFFNCQKLESLSLPVGLESIGQNAFNACGASVSVHQDNPFFATRDGILYNKEMTRIVYVSESATEVCVPAGVQDIQTAFSGRTQLRKITFEEGSSITVIPNSAFSGCTNLEEIGLPATVTAIGSDAFYRCSSLRSIEIPEGVTVINGNTFNECRNLTSVKLPDSITKIDHYAFYYCYDLVLINLPKNLQSIGNYAFCNCQSLCYLDLPEGLTSIGNRAFDMCKSLTTVVLPQSLTSLGSSAFSPCQSLYKIINRSDISISLGSTNSSDMAYYAKVLVDKEGNVSYAPADSYGRSYLVVDDFLYSLRNGTYTMMAYLGSSEKVTLPESVNGNPYTIQNMRGVIRLVIPEGVTEIPYNAFADCYTLVEVDLPDSLQTIGSSAFLNCKNLQSVVIPDQVHTVSKNAFQYCYNMTEVKIGSGLTEISEQMFHGCKSLKEVVIPDQIKKIGNRAFCGCTSLRSITIPDNVTSLGTAAFAACSSLEEIVIGDKVTNIKADVFSETAYAQNPEHWSEGALYICGYLIDVKEDLTTFFLREGISVIAEDAFDGCYLIRTLSLGGSQPLRLADLTNLETLIITEIPQDYLYEYFSNSISFPATLKNIVLGKGVRMRTSFLKYLSNVTIFVEDTLKDTRWDDHFSGWNQGNAVVYGDKWITAVFRDDTGSIISSQIIRNSAIIRQPYRGDYTDDTYRYIFLGYDMDGDGIPDSVPATSTVDLNASAVYAREYRCVKEGHLFGDPMTVTSPTCTDEGLAYQACAYCCHRESLILNALGHQYESLVTLPTCTEEGYTTHTCAECGYSYKDDMKEATGHKDGPDATCIEAQRCTVCGEVLKAALGHDYTQTVLQPTCMEQGYTVYACDRCGDCYREAWGAPLGHVTNSSATCTEQEICTVCGDVVTEALGHDYVLVFTDATCTEGKYAINTCQRCGDQLINQIAPANGHRKGAPADCTNDQVCTVCGFVFVEKYGHDYKSYVTPPSCLEEGYTAYTCKNCGDGYKDHFVPAAGHVSGGGATCVLSDLCKVCYYVITPAKGHDYTETVTPPTCTEMGYTTYDCNRCDNSYKTLWTQAAGHREGAGATCTEDQICTVCSIILVKALGHDHQPTVTPPTCTAQGYTTFRCSHCEDVYVDLWTDPVNHTPGPEATCTEDQSCTVCGWVLTQAWGHSYDSVVTPPTCTEEGFTTYTCLICHDSFIADYLPMVSHSYHTVVTPPTCTEEGFTTYTCLNCQSSYVADRVPALTHSYHSVITEPTCTEGGFTVKTCTACGYSFTDEATSALGHDYVETVTMPTCTEQGYTTYACNRCDDCYTTLWTQAMGHREGTAATCTEDQICTVCGITLVKAYGHDYLPTVTSPTCTTQGYTTYDCSQCDESYVGAWTDPVAHTPGSDATCTEDQLCTVCGAVVNKALGHNYNSVVTPPTCTEEGYTTYTCVRCGDSYVSDRVSVTAHGYHSVVTPPTCTEEGYTTRTCTACGYSFKDEITDATGHVPGPEANCTEHQFCIACGKILVQKFWHDYETTVIPASCLGQGRTIYDCRRCGHSYVSNFTPVGDHVAGPEPTCTEDQVCTVCDSTLMDKLGHDYVSVVTAPTCTEEGYTTHTCNRCAYVCADSYVEPDGHTEGTLADCLNDQVCITCGVVLIEKLGHNYSSMITEPTCTEQGYTTHTCFRCHDTYTDAFVEPLGHTKEAPADCLNDQICIVCGAVLVEKLGHDYVSESILPTCTESGIVTCTCSRCGDSYIDSEQPARGHMSGDWIVDQEAAPGVEGKKHSECIFCGEVLDSAVIEALPVIPEPETLPETEDETESSVTSETIGEAETEAVTEKAPAKGGCSGAVFSGMTLLLLAFATLPLTVKRKKEKA